MLDTEEVGCLKDDSIKDIWNDFRRIFLEGIERIENKSSSKEVFADGR
jgi:hypothetical protein